MRKISLIFCAALVFPAVYVNAGEAGASASVSPIARVLFSSADFRSRAAADSELPEYIPAIIRVASDADIPDFVIPLGRRADLALVNVPADRISEVMSAPGIIRMEAGICGMPDMDMARRYCGLAEAQAGGADLPRSFTGEGVVCGFTDTGFDPAHVNFADRNSGASRVKLLANYGRYLPHPDIADSDAAIAAWTTDDSANWHATHVAGILAGSYDGPDAPYMGVAPDAEIVGTTSSLDAAYLLAGCDRVVEYARSQGKPAVINMSISSFTGPRDGSTLFNEYMAMIASEAAVCVSAGNDGSRDSGYFRFSPSAEKPAVEARVLGSDWDAVDVSGIADLWSRDSTPFSLQPFVWDDLEHRVCLTLPPLDPAGGGDPHIEYTSDNTPALASLPGFTVSITLSCEVNPDNGRFNAAAAISYFNNNGEHYSGPYDASKSRYHVGFRLSAPDGAEIDCHVSSSLMMMSCADSTAPAFSNALTINDFCCGDGVIAVGAICTRTTVPQIGSDYLRVVTSATPGTPASFTSFGDTPSGSLPHISAPGAPVISSISQPYIDASEAPESDYSAKVESAGRPHIWGEASGTSMSSPYAAGVLALWLQADPSLTPSELKTIAIETATSPSDPSDPRWGAGMIDALAGLRRVLGLSSLTSVTAEPPTAEFRLEGATLVCTPLRLPLLSLAAYTPDGRLLASLSFPAVPVSMACAATST